MKYCIIIALMIIGFSGIKSGSAKNFLNGQFAPPDSAEPYHAQPPGGVASVKKAWKLNQLFYDSVAAEIDTSMAKFRLVPTQDSNLYFHDGSNAHLFYWDGVEVPANSKLALYADKNNMTNATLIFAYDIIYLDANNLILKLDLRGKNLPINIIEYRLVVDPTFFN